MVDDTYAVLLPGWSGNPISLRPGPRRQAINSPSSLLDCWPNVWSPVQDERKRRALAIYREAVNMAHYHSQPYAVLGFYKLIEIAIQGKNRRAYIEAAVSNMLDNDQIEEYQLRYIGYPKLAFSEDSLIFSILTAVMRSLMPQSGQPLTRTTGIRLGVCP
jgi:hypothetical protein